MGGKGKEVSKGAAMHHSVSGNGNGGVQMYLCKHVLISSFQYGDMSVLMRADGKKRLL